MRREIYAKRLELSGEEDKDTIREALCYAHALVASCRYNDTKALMRKCVPVARRALGNSHEFTLRMRSNYAEALYRANGATLDDLREAVETLEETDRTARRVFGGVHPIAKEIEGKLRDALAALRARETPSTSN